MSELWDDSVAPGGYVCATCGMPTESEPCAAHGAGQWRPCGKGPCSAEDGHNGTCAEASGWPERQSPIPDARKSGGQVLCWCVPGSPETPVRMPHSKNDRCAR